MTYTESPVNHETHTFLPAMQTSYTIMSWDVEIDTNMISGVLIGTAAINSMSSGIHACQVFNHGEPAVKKQYINISVPGTC